MSSLPPPSYAESTAHTTAATYDHPAATNNSVSGGRVLQPATPIRNNNPASSGSAINSISEVTDSNVVLSPASSQLQHKPYTNSINSNHDPAPEYIVPISHVANFERAKLETRTCCTRKTKIWSFIAILLLIMVAAAVAVPVVLLTKSHHTNNASTVTIGGSTTTTTNSGSVTVTSIPAATSAADSSTTTGGTTTTTTQATTSTTPGAEASCGSTLYDTSTQGCCSDGQTVYTLSSGAGSCPTTAPNSGTTQTGTVNIP